VTIVWENIYLRLSPVSMGQFVYAFNKSNLRLLNIYTIVKFFGAKLLMKKVGS
jgi:hypothetical protein